MIWDAPLNTSGPRSPHLKPSQRPSATRTCLLFPSPQHRKEASILLTLTAFSDGKDDQTDDSKKRILFNWSYVTFLSLSLLIFFFLEAVPGIWRVLGVQWPLDMSEVTGAHQPGWMLGLGYASTPEAEDGSRCPQPSRGRESPEAHPHRQTGGLNWTLERQLRARQNNRCPKTKQNKKNGG